MRNLVRHLSTFDLIRYPLSQMFQKRFRRTDSAESNNSSLASFFLSRNNSKTKQNSHTNAVTSISHSVIERSASGGVSTIRELHRLLSVCDY